MQPMPDGIDKPSSSELTTRLLRRYVEPVGVIDTRHPQQLQARTAGWIAQHFGLLDHWRRYESDESGPTADQNLVLAATARSQEDSAAGGPMIAADPGIGIAQSSSSIARVSQPGARLPDAWVSPPSSEAHSQALLSRLAVGTKDSEGSGRQQGPLGDTRLPASTSKYSNARNLNLPNQGTGKVAPVKAITSPMPMLRLSRQSGEGSMAGRQEIQRTAAAGPAPGRTSTGQELAGGIPRHVDSHGELATGEGRSRVGSGAKQAMPVVVQRQAEPAPIDPGRGATGPPEINPERTPVVAELAPLASPPPVLIHGRGATGPPEINPERTPVVAELAPLASPPPVLIHGRGATRPPEINPKRTPVVAELAPPASPPPVLIHGRGATRPPELNPKRTPVVAELAPLASPPPVLIWRKSDDGSSNSTAAGPAASSSLHQRKMPPGPMITPQGSNSSGRAEPSSTVGTETAPTAAAPPPSANHLDMAQLAEQVSRMLARELAVARERRGMKH